MARGDMTFDTLTVGGEIEILNRKEFEAVPQTIDFSNVEAGADGVKVVKAGTPVNADGVPVSSTPWTGAMGIVLHDTYEDAPQVAALKVGYVHVTRAQTSSGLTYNTALVTALNAAGCRIAFEEPVITASYNPSSSS